MAKKQASRMEYGACWTLTDGVEVHQQIVADVQAGWVVTISQVGRNADGSPTAQPYAQQVKLVPVSPAWGLMLYDQIRFHGFPPNARPISRMDWEKEKYDERHRNVG